MATREPYGSADQAPIFYAAAIGHELMSPGGMAVTEHPDLVEALVDVTDWAERVNLAVEMALALDQAAKSKRVVWRGYRGNKMEGNYDILATIELFAKFVLESIFVKGELPSSEEISGMAMASLVHEPK